MTVDDLEAHARAVIDSLPGHRPDGIVWPEHECWWDSKDRQSPMVTHDDPVRVDRIIPIDPGPGGPRWRVTGVRCNGTPIEWSVNSRGREVP